jgi:AcrR family transcriptional regulator
MLFAQHGFAGAAAEEIVARAGVTRGALYHHFKNGKEELFRAVLVEVSAETVERVAARARAQTDAWDALVAGIDEFLDACASPEVQRIVLIDGPAVIGWDALREIDRDHGLGAVESAVRRAIDAGQLIPQPSQALAHVIVGAVHEAAMVVAEADDPAAARAEMGATVRRLLDGLRAPATS